MQIFTTKRGGDAQNRQLEAQENITKLWCKAPLSISLFKAIVSNPREYLGLALSIYFQV
jgi:hypothetical protein